MKQKNQHIAMTHSDFTAQLLSMEDSLRRFAHRLTMNNDEANDLVQDTFLKAFTYIEQFKNNTNLKAWAFTIMYNTFVNNCRRKAKQNTTFDRSENQFLINNRPDQMTPDVSFSHSEICQKINLLAPEFRIPFQMHTCGYKYKEIADKLNLKIGTVKNRIYFSRKKLMVILKDYDR